MNISVSIILFWVTAFLLGSIPTAYLAGRIFKGVDIRLHGSGNVGATNAFRVLGKKIGALVFAIDFLKGFLPAALLPLCLPQGHLDVREVGLWIGTGAVAGHVFTPFLDFKGGKGIATGGGVLCGSFPLLFLITLVIWVAVFIMTRIVSISSLIASASLVISSTLFGLKKSIILTFFLIALFIIWTHRSNIFRIINGSENKPS